jgi:hypothetical protein
MSLIKKISKSIDASIDDFCSAIATKFDLDKDELVKLWTENGGSKKSKTVKKRSAYVNYSSHIRSVILEENPEITFGEISKETSKRWKLLSDEEKEQYKSKDGESVNAQVSAPKKSKTASKKTAVKDDNDLNSKKVAELKSMCKDKGLPVKGTKQDLIDRLSEKPASTEGDAESSVGSPTASENGSDVSSLSGASEQEGEDEEESDAEEEKPEVNYSDMTLVKLREVCKEKGIATKGNKNELIHRLMA